MNISMELLINPKKAAELTDLLVRNDCEFSSENSIDRVYLGRISKSISAIKFTIKNFPPSALTVLQKLIER